MPTPAIDKTLEEKFTTVAVRFKTAGKLFYFDSAGLELQPDDWVIADTGKGSEAGRVILPPPWDDEASLRFGYDDRASRVTASMAPGVL